MQALKVQAAWAFQRAMGMHVSGDRGGPPPANVTKLQKLWAFMARVSLQKVFKDLFFVVVVSITLILAYNLIDPFNIDNDSTAGAAIRDNDVLLFFISFFASWMISAWFATFTSTDKIDTVAEQSFDKMSKLTVQLEQVKVFLSESISVGNLESKGRGDTFARKTLEHRISGAIKMLDIIGTSNEALSSDWLGVVSSPTQRRLKDKIQQLSKLSDYIEEAGDKISDHTADELSKEIPGANRLIRYVTSGNANPAAVVSQVIRPGATERAQTGSLTIDVIRDTWTATGTGRFAPPMDEIPRAEARLVQHPDGVDATNVTFSCGVGTLMNFNIHVRSAARNVFLPYGPYIFEYIAEIPGEEEPAAEAGEPSIP